MDQCVFKVIPILYEPAIEDDSEREYNDANETLRSKAERHVQILIVERS